jgi:hypothetical protein
MSKTSDNVNLDFPARMADGRIFTDYRPNCLMNNLLSNNKDSFEYRYFLTNSGNSLERQRLEQIEKEVKCTSCTYDTVLPVKTVMNCNQGICSIGLNDPNGLGIERTNTFQQ